MISLPKKTIFIITCFEGNTSGPATVGRQGPGLVWLENLALGRGEAAVVVIWKRYSELLIMVSVTSKNLPKNDFTRKIKDFDKNCLRMWEIWAS